MQTNGIVWIFAKNIEKLWNCEICEIENSVFAEYAGAKGN